MKKIKSKKDHFTVYCKNNILKKVISICEIKLIMTLLSITISIFKKLSKKKQWNPCRLPRNLISFLLNNTIRKRSVIMTMETNKTDTTATPAVLHSGSNCFCSWTSLKPVEQYQGNHYQQSILLCVYGHSC